MSGPASPATPTSAWASSRSSGLADLLQELRLEQLVAVAREIGSDGVAGDVGDLALAPDRVAHEVAADELRSRHGQRRRALDAQRAGAVGAGAAAGDGLLEE